MIGILLDPQYRPQTPVAPCYKRIVAPNGVRLDQIDVALLKETENAGLYGIRIWELLNRMADEQGPASRGGAREFRLELWQKLRRLLRIGIVARRARIWVTTFDLPKLSVNRRRRPRPGSTPTLLRQNPQRNQPETRKPLSPLDYCQKGPIKASNSAEKTKSADHNPPVFVNPLRQVVELNSQIGSDSGSVHEAARSVAQLPRKRRRRWTGWLVNRRCWRDQEIVLADGSLAFVFGVLRNQVVFTLDKGKLLGGFDGEAYRWGVVPAEGVKIFKNPSAVLLGSSKAGVKERPSEAKKAAARANGLKPCRHGRRRSRPPSAKPRS